MKHTLLTLTLLTSMAAARAQVAVLSPPTSDGVNYEFARVVPSLREDGFRFAQVRPDESRDRNPQRPPGSPGGQPPGERRESFGSGAGGGTSFSSDSGNQNRVIRLESRGRSLRPVVVTSKPLDAKEFATVEEDLGIMARLLEKEIEREAGAGGPPNAMGIALTRLEGRGPSVMLLEGYGAVFTFNVRMPLTPPPARPAEKKADRPTDSPWERTRRELFGSGDEGGGRGGAPGGQASRYEFKAPSGFVGGGGGMMGFGGSGVIGDTWGGRIAPPEQYDAKKVEGLKKSILEAFKQAGNIRALKADDYLAVVVQSGSGGGSYGPVEVAVETRTTTSSSGGSGTPRVETFVKGPPGGDGPRSGTLTVRAKKSDAEDFAKGKLTAEQFAKKALVNLH